MRLKSYFLRVRPSPFSVHNPGEKGRLREVGILTAHSVGNENICEHRLCLVMTAVAPKPVTSHPKQIG